MERSGWFHKRTCYFTPQDLSSVWCHGPQPGWANQGPFLRQQHPLLPPPTMPRAQGRAPVQPVKETVRNFQHTGCKNKRSTPTFWSATDDDDDDTGWQKSYQHVAKIRIKKKLKKKTGELRLTTLCGFPVRFMLDVIPLFTSSSCHVLLVLFFCLAFLGLWFTSICFIKNNPPLFQRVQLNHVIFFNKCSL